MQIEYRGELFTIGALIDPGCQWTLLTERIISRLQLPYSTFRFEIVSIRGQNQSANIECEFVLYARRCNLRIPIKAIVFPKVTRHLLSCTFKIPNSSELEALNLADPTFTKSSQIDLILGND